MFVSTDIIGILGRRGCGKSYLCGRIQDVYPRKIIFDTLHEYPSDLPCSYSFDEFSHFIESTENNPSFTHVARFDVESAGKSEIFDQMLRLLYYRGSVTLVIEEIQNFSDHHNLPPFLEQVLLTGRHRDISIIFTTQRPAVLHKTILSQCSHLFVGQLHSRNDVREVSEFLGQDSKDLFNLVKTEFIWWRPGENPQKIKNSL